MKIIKIACIMLIVSFSCIAVNVSAQENKPLIQFGIIADIQYADCESGATRFYRNSLKKLDDCISSLNDEKVQFTVNLGDVVDRNFADLDSVLIRLKHLKGKVYNTTGNHDYHGISNNQVLYDKLNMPSEYYSFKKKNWIFVMLNTNEVSTYANIDGTEKEKELAVMQQNIKSSGGIQGAKWNGGIRAKQLKWMNNILAKAEKVGDNVLIFSHHPFYPESAFTALNNM